ncbi:MAG: DUF3298 domain-containing protein [Bacteroidales bacterium]|nr:DUF3298 domain-containing protein [Bacteroidales bacterium]
MKKAFFLFSLCALLLVACKHEPKPFTTHDLSGNKYWIAPYTDIDDETIGCEGTYAIVWPDKGTISPAAERELILLCFGDSNSDNVDAALNHWLSHPNLIGNSCESYTPVDSLKNIMTGEMYSLEVKCKTDSNLALFSIRRDEYAYGAIHGLYDVRYLTIDLSSGNVIHISDLVTDTARFRIAIASAIHDLDVNKDVRDCLYEEERDAIIMPEYYNFYIDSARNGIYVEYGIYEIAPYACGIQTIFLPIFWLSKHVPLTPYAKKLFGPDSYIE